MLDAASWPAVARLLERCLALAAAHELPGTLMLVGEPGLGSEALALELAAGLACHGGPPAGCTCDACERVRRGIHPDVELIAPSAGKSDSSTDQTLEQVGQGRGHGRRLHEPTISISQIRDVVGRLDQRPYEGKRRVFVLTSCHTPPLTNDAASAFLKALEEPPPVVTFLLLAANPERVLPTILSRSVQVRVPAATPEQLLELVAAACQTDPAQAEALLAACRGEASPVLAAAEILIAEEIPAATLADCAGELDRLLPAALNGDGSSLLAVAGLLQRTPEGLTLALASLLRLATRAEPHEAERFLAAAASLLAAERRRAALRLDVDTAVIGALAPFATRTA